MAPGRLRARAALAVCASALAASLASVALAKPPEGSSSLQAPALAALARLASTGAIDSAAASADRAAIARAVRLIDLLPRRRAQAVASALRQLDVVAPRLTPPRALALFGQLAVNETWFARHGLPPAFADVTDSQGVVYRYFPGAAFEFHPLANFTALNNDATSKDVSATAQLAAALEARGVPEHGGGTGWEYYFDFSGGSAPWLSGFSQAIAAQAFARAAKLLPAEAPSLLAEANAAFETIPGRLDERVEVGTWIKLYAFSRTTVLNAQLQTAISLASYASLSGNPAAATLATDLRNAAARALPLYDTGFWSYYSLSPRTPSSLSYQDYVVQLLQTLARTDPRFAAAATRFAGYSQTAPLLRLANAGPDTVEFWVSKPASVRVSGLGPRRVLAVGEGWNTIRWAPGHAGIYPVELEATDWAGNHAAAEALPIVRVVAPPPSPTKASHGGILASSAPPTVPGAAASAIATAPTGIADLPAIRFPSSLSEDGLLKVRVGCRASCLYLVVLQRIYDRAPVLATRGALAGDSAATVELPKLPIRPGSYRFELWLVPSADPTTVSLERGPTMTLPS